MEGFEGYHSEWNLGSPGGWDYQRMNQIIGKAVWQRVNSVVPTNVELDFDHPTLFPIHGFVDMLVDACRKIDGNPQGFIAVVAEEETLDDVTENKNLVTHLSGMDGISSALMAPQSLELSNGRVCYEGEPVSIIFMDFNTDVLISLHKEHDLSPVLQAVKEKRVINPRGTEPINVKSMFEVITGTHSDRFHDEIVQRTPWTRQFYERKTTGPGGETIDDLIEWTRKNWDHLVLKPERGYSGHGVRVGVVNNDADEAVTKALTDGNYIVQEKIPLHVWSEEIPVLSNGQVNIETVQTDFRCLMGPKGLFGFLGRYGGVPTNVGSGGGVQPLGVLQSDMSVREAVNKINDAMLNMDADALLAIDEMQKSMALDYDFTYLLGPIKIALRPRIITESQITALRSYCDQMWQDCLTLEKMWHAGELKNIVNIDDDELAISGMHPWGGSPAIIASDGLFNFGANPESV